MPDPRDPQPGRESVSDALSDRFHRRDFLLASTAAAAGVALPGLARSSLAARVEAAPRPARQARNCIFMVSDGMSTGTLSLANLWARRREGRESRWVGLWSHPGVRRSSQQTGCADSLVTDSAAAGSAWGSGRHVNIGSINVAPDGRQLLPILIRARQAGKRTGVVTTTRVCHATPASFCANAPRRDLEGLIAGQMLERGLDVMLGGGAKFFPDELLARHHGVAVVRDDRGLTAASADGRLLGLFAQSHLPFEIERPETVPTLAAMTSKALTLLSRGDGGPGFLLQIEGGRVDHAAHNNDAATLIREQIELDRALGVALDFLMGRDDTLLIVTTDHANANPGLTLYGKEGADAFDRLDAAKRSFDWVFDETTGVKPPRAQSDRIAALAEQATGVVFSTDEKRLLRGAVEEDRIAPFAAANKWPSVLGGVLADHFGVAFASPNHTADLTEVTAIGPGSELIPPLVDNTDLHGVMVAALGLPEGKLLPGMDEPMLARDPPKPD